MIAFRTALSVDSVAVDCLMEKLAEEYGKGPRGRPKHQDWYLVRIDEHYRSLKGTQAERMEALCAFAERSMDQTSALLARGRKLRRELGREMMREYQETLASSYELGGEANEATEEFAGGLRMFAPRMTR